MAAERPKIVVLDGYCLNPGDLSWDKLESLGDCTYFDRTAADDVAQRARDADIAITNKALLPREVIAELPRLKCIGVMATGYNVVDCDAARERGIPVTNVPTYGTSSVAQMVFAHVLNFTQHVADHAAAVRQGSWTSASDWCFWEFPLAELDGMTMGIVGFGRIGQATGRLAHAFGMRVIAHDAFPVDAPDYAQMTDLDTVFRESDVVSLHCPLTAENQQLVNEARLAQMKPTAILINTSRGPLIDEAALAAALNSGQIAGAGLDVLMVEPPPSDNPLLTAKNCQITPHIAWATHAARARLLDTVVENVAAFLRGEPQNVVNA